MGNFFKNFPDIDYEYTPGILKKSVDILRRTDVTSRLLDSNQYDQVILQDGQTPQSAAIDYYGDVSLHWSFFITNRLINPFYDWPQSYEKLNKRIDSKYAGVSLYVTENSNGLTMDTQSATSSYSIGDTVLISGSSEVTSTLVDYDRTTGYMQLSGAEDLIGETVSGWTITDSSGSKKMYVGRKFDQSRYALHHFRDTELSSEVNSIDVHRSPFRTIGSSRYIDLYISGTAKTAIINDGASIITNEKYESELNERKRSIRVYSKNVIQEIETVLKGALSRP